MDKTELVKNVAEIFRINGHSVETDVEINFRRIDVVAKEIQGLFPKTILIECAEYKKNVDIGKAQDDVNKLNAAREKLGAGCFCAHVSLSGYSPQASGYLSSNSISFSTYANLIARMINFSPYIDSVESDGLRPIILKEYQETTIYFDAKQKETTKKSMKFIDDWIKESTTGWLTILGDYGVGKSWTLKKVLFSLSEKYKSDPENAVLPFFIPLQSFSKSFDYENLIVRTLSKYGLSGVHFGAFQFLSTQGRILFLLDSFDEMAQKLSRNVIRENLLAILEGVQGGSKVIMTSRPNYFENRAERIQMIDWVGGAASHRIDVDIFEKHRMTAAMVAQKLTRTDFARLTDLTAAQCMKLFDIALEGNDIALNTLKGLFRRFQNLGNIAQRAVIARLLVTVAETLAAGEVSDSGFDLIPTNVKDLNSGKIFEIVIYNLIHRDIGIGDLPASIRLRFLRTLAVFLQMKTSSQAASPSEVRAIVLRSTADIIAQSGGADLQLEEYYRVCRRHAGLTTLGQFEDTSGRIDLPVDIDDVDSPILFSHNSLREYLVADSIADWVENDGEYDFMQIGITNEICSFFWDIVEFRPALQAKISSVYHSASGAQREILFRIIYYAIKNKNVKFIKYLGVPAVVSDVDIGEISFAGLQLDDAAITGCLSENTDFRNSILNGANFSRTDIAGSFFDGAKIVNADFRAAHIHSIYVNDKFGIGTSGLLRNKEARQWLFSNGALVHPVDDLNPLLGRPWYEAAREVVRTVLSKPNGTHQEASLAKGTDLNLRSFASDFVDHLVRKNVLRRVFKSNQSTGWVVKLNMKYIGELENFIRAGIISDVLNQFFIEHQ